MPDADRFRAPVDVVEPQIAYLARPQAIGREQLQDGMVSQSHRCRIFPRTFQHGSNLAALKDRGHPFIGVEQRGNDMR